MNMSFPVQCRLASYDEAIRKVNSLQTNSAHLKQVMKDRQREAHLNVKKTADLLSKLDISAEDLNSLNVIHVSGTKGKGSTCAFLESILRLKGFKTGFYSSPHLVNVTERIRLDGSPISQEKFSSYCDRVFEAVCGNTSVSDRPPYFQFLTVLAFHIFLQEKVDVTIVEVGIGGAYDNTNVIEKPVICGITSLGLDHTNILGKTIEEIAWHKAGIMKEGTPTFVDYHQPPNAFGVLEAISEEIGSHLRRIPKLDDYDWSNFPPKSLSLFGKVQERNASLALQLARAFVDLKSQKPVTNSPFILDVEEALGLKLTTWPGRSQVLTFDGVTFFLDGAHTHESIEACVEWFKVAKKERISETSSTRNVLIFHVIKDRNGEDMLDLILKDFKFDLVIFCSTLSRRQEESDNTNHNTNLESQLAKCFAHQEHLKRCQNNNHNSVVIPYINDALGWLVQHHKDVPLMSHNCHNLDLQLSGFEIELPDFCCDQVTHMNVLVTGSFHLVGGVLEEIQPDTFCKTEQDLQREQKIISKYEQLSLRSSLCEKTKMGLKSVRNEKSHENGLDNSRKEKEKFTI